MTGGIVCFDLVVIVIAAEVDARIEKARKEERKVEKAGDSVAITANPVVLRDFVKGQVHVI
jgi:hypothetical protein